MNSAYGISGRRATDITASIETAISHGALRPGQTLPPIRALASDLGVNPNTVAAAYRLLRDRGSIATHGRHGSRVRDRPATTPPIAAITAPPGTRDLTHGGPDPDLLPRLNPTPPTGTPPLYDTQPLHPALREAAETRLHHDQVPAHHLTATAGALDGVERVLRAHLRPGDTVAVADPGWHHLTGTIAALGLRLAPVPEDDEGIDTEALRDTLRRPVHALVITSRAHNPTGSCLTAARADALHDLLAGHPDLLVIDDDHAAELATTPAHTLAAATPHWAYLRSASKTYGPDLRLALLAADPDTITRVNATMAHGPRWVSHLLQTTLTHLWNDPDTTALVEKARHSYARRRQALTDALTRLDIPSRGRDGLNLWIPVPDETTTVTRLLAHGWAVAPGAPFRHHSPPAIRVTTATLPTDDAERLATDIAAARPPATTPV